MSHKIAAVRLHQDDAWAVDFENRLAQIETGLVNLARASQSRFDHVASELSVIQEKIDRLIATR